MSTLDTLNLTLALGFIVITICFIFITFFLIQTLKSIGGAAEDISDTTRSIKEKIQMKALAAIPALLVALAGRVIKRKRG